MKPKHLSAATDVPSARRSATLIAVSPYD